MGKLIDLTGQKLGKWLVLGRAPNRDHMVMWQCRCECGTNRIVTGANLRKGLSESCGCVWREKPGNLSHGYAKTNDRTLYSRWAGMIARCYNPKHQAYPNYGGRGITVCKEWWEFANWLRDMGTPSPGDTLERVDNSKGYYPKNVRWKTSLDQGRNKRNNRMVNWNGVQMPLSQACEQAGMDYDVVSARINALKWDDHRALTQPIRKGSAR